MPQAPATTAAAACTQDNFDATATMTITTSKDKERVGTHSKTNPQVTTQQQPVSYLTMSTSDPSKPEQQQRQVCNPTAAAIGTPAIAAGNTASYPPTCNNKKREHKPPSAHHYESLATPKIKILQDC